VIEFCEGHFGSEVDQLFRERLHFDKVASGPASVHPQV